MACTDKGSNEIAARRLIASEVADMPNIYFWDQDCLEHAPHLVVMSSLLQMDSLLEGKVPWRYWSSLAMFSHTCRAQARDLYDCYCRLFGAQRAKETVKCMFPRPVSQRWVRIHELERRILNAGFAELAFCLAEILTNKWIDVDELRNFAKEIGDGDDNSVNCPWEAMRRISEALQASKKSNDCQRKKIESSKGPTPNELSVEQTKAYSLKMGKWRAQTLNAVADQRWGQIIKVMNHCRCPLIHISNFLKKKIARQDFIDKGGPLAQLVYGHANEIHAEFSALQMSIRLFCFVWHLL